MNCRACRSDRLDEVFSMDPMPLAGAFAATAEEARAMPKYPLTWLLCHDCGLVNVAPDIPDELIYKTYSYAASTVPALVRHHAAFAKVLTERYRKPIRLLEIGGNDGVLLNQLPSEWSLANVDPSDVAQRAWQDSTWGLFRGLDDYRMWDGEVDVVTSSNAFAHFSDIAGALDGVARILRPGGEFWIEVHDLEATLGSGQWDTIYHEHKVEWSFASLHANLIKRGFREGNVQTLPLHGGLLRACFIKEEWEDYSDPLPRPEDFEPLRRSYAERKAPDLAPHSAAYGAAARATVYLNQMWPLPIDYVIDESPLRFGKFVPGVGLPIIPPIDLPLPRTTLITAWSQAEDIKAKRPGYEGWVTAW